MVEHDLDEWYRLYHRDVFAYIRYHVRSRQDTEDIAQEVFVRVLLGVERFQGLSSPKTWILTIARRTVADWYRKQRWKKLFALHEVPEVVSEEPSLDDKVEQNEREKVLRDALQLLKPDGRDVIVLRMIYELSTEETAEVLGWSSAKTRTTLHRALKKLHGLLGADPLFAQVTAEEGVSKR